MFKIYKKFLKYFLFAIILAIVYLIIFGFSWTVSYDYINQKIQQKYGTTFHIKKAYLKIEDLYIQYAKDEQFKISAYITINNIFLNFNTNVEINTKISYDNGTIFLYPKNLKTDNINAKKTIKSFLPEKYLIYKIPEKHTWAKILLDKFLKKISANDNGIKLIFKFI